MKRIAFAIAVLTICAASCQKGLKEAVRSPENGGKLKVTAGITKASGTKVALTRDDNDLKSVWETGDTVLGFYNASGWKKVAYKVTSVDGSSGTAALEYLSGCSQGEPETAGTKVYMAYAPGKTVADIEGDVEPILLRYSLATQSGKLENLGHRALMCATGTVAADQSLSLSFTNALALVGIDTIKGLTPTKAYTVKISGTGLKNAGTFGISSEAMAFTAATDGEISTTSTFTANSEGKITGIYFAVPAASLGDLTVTVTGGTETLTATLTNKTVTAGNFYYKAAVPARPEGALAGKFSVSADKKVHFSKGNLQATYNSSASTYTWGFAANQYDYIGNAAGNTTIDSQTNGAVVDFFGWSTASTTYGISTSTNNDDYSGDFIDWGKNIGDGNTWRTLSKDEWTYLFNTRTASTVSGAENARYAKATVNSKAGVILLPDTYAHPEGVTALASINTASAAFTANTYDSANWAKMESAGAVFLPAAGYRNGSTVQTGSARRYWSSSASASSNVYIVSFNSSNVSTGNSVGRCCGCSVRLITECQ